MAKAVNLILSIAFLLLLSGCIADSAADIDNRQFKSKPFWSNLVDNPICF